MLLVIRFDMDADIVDVPQVVIQNMDEYYQEFYAWLENPENRHSYWHDNSANGGSKDALWFRSDAFLEWLNMQKVCRESKATLVASGVWDWDGSLPLISF